MQAKTIGSKDAFYASTKSNGENKAFGIDVPVDALKRVEPILKSYFKLAGLTLKEGTEKLAGGKVRITFTGKSVKALRVALRAAKGKTEVPTFRGKEAKYFSEVAK